MVNNNVSNYTPLMWAACWNYAGIVDIFLKNKANVNAVDSKGNTPLIFAASKGHIEVIKLLLKYGADKNKKDSDGNMAINWAKNNAVRGLL